MERDDSALVVRLASTFLPVADDGYDGGDGWS